jgi:hypothetical protein
MRFRLLLILIGALLVAATWTFPLWQPLLPTGNSAPGDSFPGLAAELQPLFAALPPERQAAYRALSDTEPEEALAMLTAALTPAEAAPASEFQLPELVGSVIVAVGAFGEIDPIRSAAGDVTVYQDANGAWLLRFENFSVINGPDLHVLLSLTPNPRTPEAVRAGGLDLDLGALKGVTGNQHYPISADEELRQYRSVVLFSVTLDEVYSSAQLFIRNL